MTHDIFHDRPAGSDPLAPVTAEQLARQQAIRQLERKRRFWAGTVAATASMILLVVIWATTEYRNAGGWPAHGFSQSSGIHDVWNFWIIYPLGAWVLLTAVGAWFVYVRRPISEGDISREIQRQGQRR
jgi:hypothetical protein